MPEIITLDEMKAYLKVPRDNSGSDEVLALVKAASEGWVQTYCSRRFVSASYTERYNGSGRKALRVIETPVSTSPLATVMEDGVALGVAAVYSTSADVIYDQVSGIFHRLPTSRRSTVQSPGWADGIQNIEVTYTGGYPDGSVPGDLRLATCFIGALMWRHSDRFEAGLLSRADGAHSVSFADELPMVIKTILNAYRRPPAGGL